MSAPRLYEVARSASARLAVAGVPHALIGGLAVAAHGYARATDDVDFLLPQAALTAITKRPMIVRLTELVDGVRVDYIAAEPNEELLEQAIHDAKGTPPVLPLAALIYTKLETGRRRDQGDVVELVKCGAVDVERVRRFLAAAGDPALLESFEELVEAAGSDA